MSRCGSRRPRQGGQARALTPTRAPCPLIPVEQAHKGHPARIKRLYQRSCRKGGPKHRGRRSDRACHLLAQAVSAVDQGRRVANFLPSQGPSTGDLGADTPLRKGRAARRSRRGQSQVVRRPFAFDGQRVCAGGSIREAKQKRGNGGVCDGWAAAVRELGRRTPPVDRISRKRSTAPGVTAAPRPRYTRSRSADGQEHLPKS